MWGDWNIAMSDQWSQSLLDSMFFPGTVGPQLSKH